MSDEWHVDVSFIAYKSMAIDSREIMHAYNFFTWK